MSGQFFFRFSPPSEVPDAEFEALFRQKTVCFSDIVLVREMGERGDHRHYHGLIRTDRGNKSFRDWVSYHLKLKGNAQVSIKAFDPQKADRCHQYLAKGPTSVRLVMPVVIIDQIGLMWDRLHHAYHDEMIRLTARSKRTADGAPKLTFSQKLLAEVRSAGVTDLHEIKRMLYTALRRDFVAFDEYWVKKVVLGIYMVVNPEGCEALIGPAVDRLLDYSAPFFSPPVVE